MMTNNIFEKFIKNNVLRRILSLWLAAAMLLTSLTFPLPKAQAAENPEKTAVEPISSISEINYNRYYYNQLTDDSKKFYQAMLDGIADGTLKTGTEDVDLRKYFSQEELKAHSENFNNFLNIYGAARDAFQYDNPDVFYIDYSNLTVRLSLKGGVYYAYLGIGRTNSYFLNGFTKDNIEYSINNYEKKLNEVVEEANKETTLRDKIMKAHDNITDRMAYRYEDEVTDERCNARTAYDCFIFGEGVCESYSRAFKAVLDRLQIPCLVIYGTYRPNDKINEPHAWNYVLLDNRWLGVDVTHDDPSSITSGGKEYEKKGREFCLVGQVTLSSHHIPVGVMSEANYEFTYPSLAIDTGLEEENYSSADSKLKAKFMKDVYNEDGVDQDSGTIYVSYDGKNYTDNAKEGKYLLARFGAYQPGDDSWLYSDWGYMTPDFYDKGLNLEPTTEIEGMGKCIRLPLPHIMEAQFAVTTLEPTFKRVNGGYEGSLYYQGDPSLLEIKTPTIYNKYGSYVAPPYPKTTSPYMGGTLYCDQSYHIKAQYDDKLIRTDEALGVELNAQSAFGDPGSSTAEKYAEISDVTFDGVDTIEFNVKPSSQFADNCTYYNFNIKGLKGEKSGKRPVNLTYGFQFPCNAYAYTAQGFNKNNYAAPQLLENTDIFAEGAKYYDEVSGDEKELSPIDKRVTHRLVMVASTPSTAQNKEMEDMLENTENMLPTDASGLVSQSYNIFLQACKKNIAKTGERVRVCVGFPAGYSYESLGLGTVFKAYHYKVNPATNVIEGIETIPITVTKQGLIMEVDSFSPFTIAAYHSDSEKMGQSLILESGEGGTITSDAKVTTDKDGIKSNPNLLTFDENNKSYNISVKADPGYQIESLTIGDSEQPLGSDKTKYEATITQQSLNDAPSTTVRATFVTQKAIEQEEEEEELAETPVITKFDETQKIIEPGQSLTISAKVSAREGTTYQWFKDGQPLEGKNTVDLVINNASYSDSGIYFLRATYSSGDAKAIFTEDSEKITINVGYPIKLDANGGELANNAKAAIGENGTIEGDLPHPEREGYVFCGWYTQADGGEAITPDTVLNKDSTIYAHWQLIEENAYDVKFDANGGTLMSGIQNLEVTESSGYKLGGIPQAHRPGYDFLGWYTSKDGGEEITIDTVFNSNTTVYAHWAEIVKGTYEITFNPNGGKLVDGVHIHETNTEGKLNSVPEPVMDGYVFTGWYTQKEGGEEISTYTVFNQNTTVYAHWEVMPQDRFNITFDATGGIMASGATMYETNKDGYLNFLPEAHQAGYLFLGWFSSRDGGVQISTNTRFNSHTTVYAHWEKIPEYGYQISFDPNGGILENGIYIYETSRDRKLAYLPAAHMDGYDFIGWFTQKEGGQQVTTDTVFGSSTILYAHWALKGTEQPQPSEPENPPSQPDEPDTPSTQPDEPDTPEKEDPVASDIKLDKSEIDLSTEKDAKAEEEISASVALGYDSSQITWDSDAENVATVKGQGSKATVTAVNEGVATITAHAGDETASVLVNVSNLPFVVDEISFIPDSDDSFTVNAADVHSNQALPEKHNLEKVSIFAWSAPDQSDINAKDATQSNTGESWSYEFPINNTPANNHFMDAKNIKVHIYATDKSTGEQVHIGSSSYDYTAANPNESVIITPYVQDYGFITPSKGSGEIAGTIGESKQMEGVRIASSIPGVDLVYRVHAADKGWLDPNEEGTYAGTMDENRQLEAIRIWLDGEKASEYTLTYRAHVAFDGWQDWVNEGDIAGTTGLSRRLEAIEVQLTPVNQN